MGAARTGRKLRITFTSDIEEQSAAHADSPDKMKSGRASFALIKAYVALASVPVVLVLGNSMLVPILPTMERKLGITNFQSSLVITLFSISAAIFIPISGYLSDRLSRKAVIIPSLILYGGAGILAGLGAVWHSYGVLIAARALQGTAQPEPRRSRWRSSATCKAARKARRSG